MYITYGKVFGGTPKIFMFWLFPENGSISEWTVNRALRFCINKDKYYIFIFAMYQNYPISFNKQIYNRMPKTHVMKNWVQY